MKILVLGGTGAMGRHLVKLLAEARHDVSVTSRSARHDAGLIRYLRGDAHDPSFFAGLLKTRWDVVVDFMVYQTAEFTTRYRQVLSSAGQYVFLSSSRVYAASETPLREDSPRLLDVCRDPQYLALDEYALAKARQENLLFASSSKNWTIIRPYITFAENRLQLGVDEKELWLNRVLTNRSIVFSKDIAAHKTTLTYGLDVSRGIAALLGQPAALGEAFHITAPESHTWAEIFELYQQELAVILGHPPRVVMTDRAPRFDWAARRHDNSQYQVLYDRLYDRDFDSSKIGRFVDLATFRPVLPTLRSCLREVCANNAIVDPPVRQEVFYDKICGERSLMRQQGIIRKAKYLMATFGF